MISYVRCNVILPEKYSITKRTVAVNKIVTEWLKIVVMNIFLFFTFYIILLTRSLTHLFRQQISQLQILYYLITKLLFKEFVLTTQSRCNKDQYIDILFLSSTSFWLCVNYVGIDVAMNMTNHVSLLRRDSRLSVL